MLSWWHRLSLQVKMTLMIILIVGVIAAMTEWIDIRLMQDTVENNVLDAALAVGQSVDQNVTSLSYLSDRAARTKELDKIMATLPDLLNIVLYAFPTEGGETPLIVASSGVSELPRQAEAPVLLDEYRRWSDLCRVFHTANG